MLIFPIRGLPLRPPNCTSNRFDREMDVESQEPEESSVACGANQRRSLLIAPRSGHFDRGAINVYGHSKWHWALARWCLRRDG